MHCKTGVELHVVHDYEYTNSFTWHIVMIEALQIRNIRFRLPLSVIMKILWSEKVILLHFAHEYSVTQIVSVTLSISRQFYLFSISHHQL